jgi:hypothetical protein
VNTCGQSLSRLVAGYRNARAKLLDGITRRRTGAIASDLLIPAGRRFRRNARYAAVPEESPASQKPSESPATPPGPAPTSAWIGTSWEKGPARSLGLSLK